MSTKPDITVHEEVIDQLVRYVTIATEIDHAELFKRRGHANYSYDDIWRAPLEERQKFGDFSRKIHHDIHPRRQRELRVLEIVQPMVDALLEEKKDAGKFEEADRLWKRWRLGWAAAHSG